MRIADKHVCIVLNEDGIVLDRVRGKAFDGDPDTVVEQAMRSGSPTIRPDVFIHDVVPGCTTGGWATTEEDLKALVAKIYTSTYTPGAKSDYFITIRKFYRWLSAGGLSQSTRY